MTSRLEKIKQNVLDKSISENWTDDCKDKYLNKVRYRINTYKVLLRTREDLQDILYVYLETKTKELKIIYEYLKKKWKI